MRSKECVWVFWKGKPYIFYCLLQFDVHVYMCTQRLFFYFPLYVQCDIGHVYRRSAKTLILNWNRCVRVCKHDFMESQTRTYYKTRLVRMMRSVPKYHALSILLLAPKEHSNSHSHKKLFGFYIAKVNMGSLNWTHTDAYCQAVTTALFVWIYSQKVYQWHDIEWTW